MLVHLDVPIRPDFVSFSQQAQTGHASMFQEGDPGADVASFSKHGQFEMHVCITITGWAGCIKATTAKFSLLTS